MSKRAVSVTLDTGNLSWLKGRAGAVGGSLSATLDQIVTAARSGNSPGPFRSVVGTIDLDPSDPMLQRADAAIHAIFEASAARPFMMRELGVKSLRTARRSRKRRA